jgi:hypothetical protein
MEPVLVAVAAVTPPRLRPPVRFNHSFLNFCTDIFLSGRSDKRRITSMAPPMPPPLESFLDQSEKQPYRGRSPAQLEIESFPLPGVSSKRTGKKTASSIARRSARLATAPDNESHNAHSDDDAMAVDPEYHAPSPTPPVYATVSTKRPKSKKAPVDDDDEEDVDDKTAAELSKASKTQSRLNQELRDNPGELVKPVGQYEPQPEPFSFEEFAGMNVALDMVSPSNFRSFLNFLISLLLSPTIGARPVATWVVQIASTVVPTRNAIAATKASSPASLIPAFLVSWRPTISRTRSAGILWLVSILFLFHMFSF